MSKSLKTEHILRVQVVLTCRQVLQEHHCQEHLALNAGNTNKGSQISLLNVMSEDKSLRHPYLFDGVEDRSCTMPTAHSRDNVLRGIIMSLGRWYCWSNC